MVESEGGTQKGPYMALGERCGRCGGDAISTRKMTVSRMHCQSYGQCSIGLSIDG